MAAELRFCFVLKTISSEPRIMYFLIRYSRDTIIFNLCYPPFTYVRVSN